MSSRLLSNRAIVIIPEELQTIITARSNADNRDFTEIRNATATGTRWLINDWN